MDEFLSRQRRNKVLREMEEEENNSGKMYGIRYQTDANFTPRLNRNSKSLAETKHRKPLYTRVQDEIDMRTTQRTRTSEMRMSRICTFTPEIDAKSRTLAETAFPKSSDGLYYNDQDSDSMLDQMDDYYDSLNGAERRTPTTTTTTGAGTFPTSSRAMSRADLRSSQRPPTPGSAKRASERLYGVFLDSKRRQEQEELYKDTLPTCTIVLPHVDVERGSLANHESSFHKKQENLLEHKYNRDQLYEQQLERNRGESAGRRVSSKRLDGLAVKLYKEKLEKDQHERHAMALEERQRQEEEAREQKHPTPKITLEEMGELCERLYVRETENMLNAHRTPTDKECTFKPKIDKRAKTKQPRYPADNPLATYAEIIRQTLTMRERRDKEEGAESPSVIEECTFKPRVNGCAVPLSSTVNFGEVVPVPGLARFMELKAMKNPNYK